jgi:hypothetical protein
VGMELVLKLFTTLIRRRGVYWLMWQTCLHWKNQLGIGLVERSTHNGEAPLFAAHAGR